MRRRVPAGGAELCVDTIGEPADPAVMLVMGIGGSMDRWEDPFCERLAAAGRFVIRYDHRDTGQSTTCPPGEPDYTGDDLAADPVRILDHLGIESAHFAGISMGGGLVQRIAVDHPERLLTITLMSTSPAGTGAPDLPPPSDELRAIFAGEDARPEPDWADREAAIEHLLADERPYAGRRGVDEEATRALLGRVYDRSVDIASAGNHFMVDGTGFPHSRLSQIRVPALIIHGTADPLFPLEHGEELARAIPGAELIVIDDLGHELPRWAWDDVLSALIRHTG